MFYSTNNKKQRVAFEEALLSGLGANSGLFMMARKDIPKLKLYQIRKMRGASYAEIAFTVLNPFLGSEIPSAELRKILNDAYDEEIIPTELQHITGKTYIMWLTKGPTYSFKDYAARFYARILNYFLTRKDQKKIVLVATSGDTGGAVAAALLGLSSIKCAVFYPKGFVSEGQRRQMTTLKDNVYAFEIDGDFDLCQAMVKFLLKDSPNFTSANSISLGRLLPQAVYPFYAYSRIDHNNEPMIASIPSGNFGDMMGTVIAKEMGLPVAKIICGVNENREFPRFLRTGKYIVEPTKTSPSSAMMISNPSNLARLIDLYGGHLENDRIMKMPDMKALRKDIASYSVNNKEHFETVKAVYRKYGVLLDPHGAVGWKALEQYLEGNHNRLSVVYETADPGKFPLFVKKATGITPPIPQGIQKQARLKERVYEIESEPESTKSGPKLSQSQIEEAKTKFRELLTP